MVIKDSSKDGAGWIGGWAGSHGLVAQVDASAFGRIFQTADGISSLGDIAGAVIPL